MPMLQHLHIHLPHPHLHLHRVNFLENHFLNRLVRENQTPPLNLLRILFSSSQPISLNIDASLSQNSHFESDDDNEIEYVDAAYNNDDPNDPSFSHSSHSSSSSEQLLILSQTPLQSIVIIIVVFVVKCENQLVVVVFLIILLKMIAFVN
jgi:hypothetical protein